MQKSHLPRSHHTTPLQSFCKVLVNILWAEPPSLMAFYLIDNDQLEMMILNVLIFHVKFKEINTRIFYKNHLARLFVGICEYVNSAMLITNEDPLVTYRTYP